MWTKQFVESMRRSFYFYPINAREMQVYLTEIFVLKMVGGQNTGKIYSISPRFVDVDFLVHFQNVWAGDSCGVSGVGWGERVRRLSWCRQSVNPAREMRLLLLPCVVLLAAVARRATAVSLDSGNPPVALDTTIKLFRYFVHSPQKKVSCCNGFFYNPV